MNKLRLLSAFLLLLIFACSQDDDVTIEDGTNPTPNLQPTGSSANDFLSGSDYAKLEIELIYVAGFRPDEQTITNFRNFMQQRLNKPGGITIIEREVNSPGLAPYTTSEAAALESELRTKYNSPDTLTFYLFFADGGHESDTSNSFVLGTAYRNTSCVIYESSIHSMSDAINEPNRIVLETTTILHELGHLLGLVDFGSPMQTPHEDLAHERHCNNSNCLMYWATESSSNMMSMGNQIPQLDANCLADIQANGGR
jgi:predicted Zn-dependent protease